jgi:ABC-type Fe3+/spermidine/putrescine transport system ATPase subunit
LRKESKMNIQPENMISFSNFSIAYNHLPVVKDLTFDIKKGERLCLIGVSGCGKTSILNAITGAIKFNHQAKLSGEMSLAGGKAGAKLKVGYVFQDLALFPHLTVRENIAFPLRIQKLAAATIREKTDGLLKMLQLWDKANAAIKELSGGQKQRVALARALIISPDIICMDEALKGLDPVLKMDFLRKLLEIQSKDKFTLIYVTHDMHEANYCAQRICVLDEGRIVQVGSPSDIYRSPGTLKVASFSGELISFPVSALPSLKDDLDAAISEIGFRPENVIVDETGHGTQIAFEKGSLVLNGIVRSSHFMGRQYRNEVAIADMLIELSGKNMIAGNHVTLRVDMSKLLLY